MWLKIIKFIKIKWDLAKGVWPRVSVSHGQSPPISTTDYGTPGNMRVLTGDNKIFLFPQRKHSWYASSRHSTSTTFLVKGSNSGLRRPTSKIQTLIYLLRTSVDCSAAKSYWGRTSHSWMRGGPTFTLNLWSKTNPKKYPKILPDRLSHAINWFQLSSLLYSYHKVMQKTRPKL